MCTASFLFPRMLKLKHSLMSLFPSSIELGCNHSVHDFFVHGERDDYTVMDQALCSSIQSKVLSMWWLGSGLVSVAVYILSAK
jgi:hypothetical protein